MFPSGALYRGDFKDDLPHGMGILYSGENEIYEGRFEKGKIPTEGRVKIMLRNGTYYEGQYSHHKRNGPGVCLYPNGEKFEGNFANDKRVGRGKMRFPNGSLYQGQFIHDQADGNGQVEDAYNSLFQVVEGVKNDGSDCG
jgi:hypothetical protein